MTIRVELKAIELNSIMKRFWEIDAARGAAVVLMVLFNYSFTLDYLKLFTLTEGWGYWWLFPRLVAGTFIFIAGVAVTISYSRNSRVRRHLLRGARIFLLGLLITAATLLLVPEAAVWFGILHFIGLSVIFSLLFMKWKPMNVAIVGAIIIAAGAWLNGIVFDFPWLMWLGFIPVFTTLDYFPLLPWFGLFLIGMAAGKKYYGKGKRRFAQPFLQKKALAERTKLLIFLGRHSLIIYLLHQPILLIILRISGLF